MKYKKNIIIMLFICLIVIVTVGNYTNFFTKQYKEDIQKDFSETTMQKETEIENILTKNNVNFKKIDSKLFNQILKNNNKYYIFPKYLNQIRVNNKIITQMKNNIDKIEIYKELKSNDFLIFYFNDFNNTYYPIMYRTFNDVLNKDAYNNYMEISKNVSFSNKGWILILYSFMILFQIIYVANTKRNFLKNKILYILILGIIIFTLYQLPYFEYLFKNILIIEFLIIIGITDIIFFSIFNLTESFLNFIEQNIVRNKKFSKFFSFNIKIKKIIEEEFNNEISFIFLSTNKNLIKVLTGNGYIVEISKSLENIISKKYILNKVNEFSFEKELSVVNLENVKVTQNNLIFKVNDIDLNKRNIVGINYKKLRVLELEYLIAYNFKKDKSKILNTTYLVEKKGDDVNEKLDNL